MELHQANEALRQLTTDSERILRRWTDDTAMTYKALHDNVLALLRGQSRAMDDAEKWLNVVRENYDENEWDHQLSKLEYEVDNL